MNITIYTKTHCPNCDAAKQLLDSNGLAYDTVDCDKPHYFDGLRAQYPEARQLPQIILNGVRIGGLAGLQAYLPDILLGRVA